MTLGPDETDFAHYRTTGDPAALAAVFDRTAPKLLLLASHWTRDPATAEDLVQVTFLQALRDAPQWHERQPLLRWLCGILMHRAQDHRRQSARRPEEPLAEVDLAGREPSPLDAAMEQERVARVMTAIDALEQPYREVLVLRLVYGLAPTAIAHAQGRPPATVRKQLERGMELLRGQLPASIGLGLATLVVPGRGLAAVRESVLAAAHPVLPAVASTLGGLLLVNKLLLSALALLVVLGIVALAFDEVVPAAPVAESGSLPINVAAKEDPTQTAQKTDTGAAVAADRIEVPAPATAPPIGPDVHPNPSLLVRVRNQQGTLLDGVDVSIDLFASPPTHRRGMTDAAGTWRIDLPSPGPATVSLSSGDSKDIDIVDKAAAEIEFVLEGAEAVSGRVLDPAGRPLADATVYVAKPASTEQDVQPEPAAITDREGRYSLRYVGKRAQIGARAPGHASSSLFMVGPKSVWPSPFDIVLEPGGTRIEGRVTDTLGKPLRSATVLASTKGRWHGVRQGSTIQSNWLQLRATTGEDGHFVIDGQAPGNVRLVAWTHEHARAVVDLVLGATESVRVDMQLPRAAQAIGTVVDSEGQPVAHARVRVGSGWPLDDVLPQARSDACGQFHLIGLPAGDTVLWVRADGFVDASIETQIAAGAIARLQCVVQHAPSIEGSVVHADGAPAAGFWIEARDLGTRMFAGRRQRTDEAGRFVIWCQSPGQVQILLRRDESRREMETVLSDLVACPSKGLVFRLDDIAGAQPSVRGVLHDQNGPLGNVDLHVRARDGRLRPADVTDPVTGAFAIPSLPSGTYTLIAMRQQSETVLGEFMVVPGEAKNLGTLTIGPR